MPNSGELIGAGIVEINRGPIDKVQQVDDINKIIKATMVSQSTNEKDTMLKIRGRKDYAYLFNPLNFPARISCITD